MVPFLHFQFRELEGVVSVTPSDGLSPGTVFALSPACTLGIVNRPINLQRLARVGILRLGLSIAEDFDCEAFLRYDPLEPVPGQDDQVVAAILVEVPQVLYLVVIHCVAFRVNLDHIGVPLDTQIFPVNSISIFQQAAVQDLMVRIICTLDVDVPLQQILQVFGRSQGLFGGFRLGKPDLDLAILLHRFDGVGPIIRDLDLIAVKSGLLILEALVGSKGDGDILTLSCQDIALDLCSIEGRGTVVDFNRHLTSFHHRRQSLEVCLDHVSFSGPVSIQLFSVILQISGQRNGHVIARPLDKLCSILRGGNADQSNGLGHRSMIFVDIKSFGLELRSHCAELRSSGFIPDKYLPVVRCAVAGLIAVIIDIALLVLSVDNGERHVMGNIPKSVAARCTNQDRDINIIEYCIVQNIIGICIKVDFSIFIVFNLE